MAEYDWKSREIWQRLTRDFWGWNFEPTLWVRWKSGHRNVWISDWYDVGGPIRTGIWLGFWLCCLLFGLLIGVQLQWLVTGDCQLRLFFFGFSVFIFIFSNFLTFFFFILFIIYNNNNNNNSHRAGSPLSVTRLSVSILNITTPSWKGA